MTKKELRWQTKVNWAAFNFFFNLPKDQRENIQLAINLTKRTMNNEKVVLHHKITPYMLCKNGNLWLSLCKISLSESPQMNHSAVITNIETNEKYDFIDNEFVLRSKIDITPTDEQIIRFMIQGMDDYEISLQLNITLDAFKRLKQKLYQKFNVKKASTLIHKVHQERTLPNMLKGL